MNTKDRYHFLLESWFETRILPLIVQSREMKNRSLQRKIGLLGNSIQEPLMELKNSSHTITPKRWEDFRRIEASLRTGSAKTEQMKNNISRGISNQFDHLTLLNTLATMVVNKILGPDWNDNILDTFMREEIIKFMHQQIQP